ncbi:unnamed protein product [Plutella xylostella]|uniref:(diamondback moth) hypothetical protein n=1 Tax=Plutella xylostella TaxID=51655 RepID=A0A8S4FVZ5_PLUXY|nr:unnamed protein product [Plutella xylostella]
MSGRDCWGQQQGVSSVCTQAAAERAAWERETGLSLDDLRRRSLEANSKETMDGKDKKDKKKKGLF